ncbi:MAG: DUF6266 family protein [Bacteroidota bacterium]
MARYKNGILGAFSGKVGAVIGASWRGIDYMRGIPKISKKPPTPKQLAQRMKMSMFRGFLLGLDEIIEICFQNYDQTSAMNGAISYNMTNSVSGVYPEKCIDFANFVFSKGDLQGSWAPQATSTETDTVNFSWTNGPFNKLRAAEDQVLLAIYSQVEKGFVFSTIAGTRGLGVAKLNVPKEFSNKTVHCYLSFYSSELGFASTNEYLGEVVIS